jgi:hypothetical protein
MTKIGVANVYNTDDYERGYSKGFLDGFQAARENPNLISPNIPTPAPNPAAVYTCRTCGIKMSGAWGYVCNLDNCPSKITASISVGAVGADYNLNQGEKNDR